MYIENRNTGLIRRFVSLFRRRELEVSPREKMFLPVINLNDNRQFRVFSKHNSADAAGSNTIYAVPNDAKKKTYITAINISMGVQGVDA